MLELFPFIPGMPKKGQNQSRGEMAQSEIFKSSLLEHYIFFLSFSKNTIASLGKKKNQQLWSSSCNSDLLQGFLIL